MTEPWPSRDPPRAREVLQQLAKHWSHKMEVSFSEQEARIAFPNGATVDLRADSETLDVRLAVPEASPRHDLFPPRT